MTRRTSAARAVEQEMLFAKPVVCPGCVEHQRWRAANPRIGTVECDWCQRRHEREAIEQNGGG